MNKHLWSVCSCIATLKTLEKSLYVWKLFPLEKLSSLIKFTTDLCNPVLLNFSALHKLWYETILTNEELADLHSGFYLQTDLFVSYKINLSFLFYFADIFHQFC